MQFVNEDLSVITYIPVELEAGEVTEVFNMGVVHTAGEILQGTEVENVTLEARLKDSGDPFQDVVDGIDLSLLTPGEVNVFDFRFIGGNNAVEHQTLIMFLGGIDDAAADWLA